MSDWLTVGRMLHAARGVGTLGIAVLASGCAPVTHHSPLMDRYDRAECIPVKVVTSMGPRTRVWDYDFRARDGRSIHISGMQVPGGRVDVRFVPEVINHVVADAGDYIYPSDVRVSAASDQLYVKAAGITAAFPRAQTWLFEYDLRRRKRTGRIRVDPQALPAECPATESPR